MTDDELRRMLHGAVPDLPAPPDRLVMVGARVRRTRRRLGIGATVAAAVAVGLVIGLPRFVVDAAPQHVLNLPGTEAPPAPPPLDEHGCPTVPPPEPSTADRPGPLVRAGATSITLCERTPASAPDARNGPPRTLTTGVDSFVARLNELTNAETTLANMREQVRQQGGSPPDELGCTMVLFPSDLSLSVRFPDGTTTVVWLDQNCGTATADGRTRYGSVLNSFFGGYRQQLALSTPLNSILDPVCPARIASDEFDGGRLGARPMDEIGRNRGDAAFLPSPLAKLTYCRYGPVAGGSASLVHSVPVAEPEPLRDALNRASAVQSVTEPTGATSVSNLVECRPLGELSANSQVDLIRIADRTGAVSELAVFRSPCPAVFQRGMGGLLPTAELLSLLDSALGPPR